MRSTLRLLVLGALLASACASNKPIDGAVLSAGTQMPPTQASGVSPVASDEANRSDTKQGLALLASQERIRPADFYRPEESIEPEVCEAALKSLNKPYAVPEDLHIYRELDGPPEGDRDYASHQAAYYLGTNDNIRWSVRKIAWPSSTLPPPTPQPTESAFIDLYGDGMAHLVVRGFARTRGGIRRKVRVVEFIDGRLGGATVNNSGLGGTRPDDDDFGTKIDFSVADVIRIGERYYALIMPLRDYDKSGRVYLAKMYDRGPPPGNQTGHEISHWFPKFICTFMPTQS